MTTKHKDYDLIMAWANGAEIEYFAKGDGFDCWVDVKNPIWDNAIYRIKTEPKHDIVLYAYAENYKCGGIALITNAYKNFAEDNPIKHRCKENIKLIYDGNTNEIKAVELI